MRGGDDRVLAFSALARDLSGEPGGGSPAVLGRLLPTVFNSVANRLNPVLIQTRLMEERIQDPAMLGQLQKLAQAVDSVQSMLRPLVMILHPSTPRLEGTDLNKLAQDCLKRVEAEAAAAGVTVDMSLDPTLVSCGVDPSQMREALTGMLRNGIQMASRGNLKRARLVTRLSGETVQVAIQDSGPPVPESRQSLAFDLASAESNEDLGLPLAATVVREHGGRISLRTQEGAGNALFVELPYIPPPPPEATEPKKGGLSGKKALVVDDEPFLLECLVEAIQNWGCEVVPCATGEEAVRQLQGGSCDFLVSDIRMPGLTGIQLFDWLKTNRPELTDRILYTTGDSFDQETRAFLDQSGVPHLGKPFDLKKLRHALDALVNP